MPAPASWPSSDAASSRTRRRRKRAPFPAVPPQPSRPVRGRRGIINALLFARVAQRAQKDRHRSKREQYAPISLRDTWHQQRHRRGKDPVQSSRPYVVAEAHPAEKTRRIVGGQKHSALPRRDHAHERGDPAIPARHPGDPGDHAWQGEQGDPTVHCGDKTRGRRKAACSPCVGFSPYQPRQIGAIRRGRARIVPGASRNYAGV